MSETFTYDAAGNQASHTDFNGKRTTFTYDQSNRLTSKVPDASFNAPTVRFTYNSSGQRASMVDASGTTSYTYDARDRQLTKVSPEGTLTYTYDAAGDLASMQSSNTGGTSLSYTYDTLNRLATVKDNRLAFGTTSYTYDNVGNLAGYEYPNGVQTSYTYDHLNRLTRDVISAGGTTLASYAYTLGAAGNRTSLTELGGRQVNHTYDQLYRLTGETIAGGSVNGSITYTYDPVGNRLSRTSSVAPVPSGTSTYDNNDRLASDTFDANGNTTASGGNTYTYDFENHLLTQAGPTPVSIVYDGDGNRVSETAVGVSTTYLVDDRNPTGYAQVLEELVNGTVQRAYTYGSSRISQNQVSGISFYDYDGHGDVRELTSGSGTLTDRYDFDSFGNRLGLSGTTSNSFLYAGEQNDQALGLYYQRARYLNTNVGRFMTTDRFEGDPASPLSLHRYLYASANPVNRRDPSGLLSLPELSAAVTIEGILDEIYLTNIVLPTIVVAVEVSFYRLGFEDVNTAIQLAADSSNPTVVLAANDLYATGNELIAQGSRTIALGKDYIDIGDGVTGVADATKRVVEAVDAFAAAGRGAILVSKVNSLYKTFGGAADDVVASLRREQPASTIKGKVEVMTDASIPLFELVLKIATSGGTSDLLNTP